MVQKAVGEETVQASPVTVDVRQGFPVLRLVLAMDDQTATTGTVAATIKAPGLTDAHTPANNTLDVSTATTRQIQLVGGEVSEVVLTPTGLDAAVKIRWSVYDA